MQRFKAFNGILRKLLKMFLNAAAIIARYPLFDAVCGFDFAAVIFYDKVIS